MYILAPAVDDTCTDVASIIGIAGFALKVIQYLVPIILIIWGTIDMVKAVVAGKEDQIKDAQKILIKRVISAVIVFLIPLLVSTLLGLFGSNDWKTCWNLHKDDGIINVGTLDL